MLFVGSWLQILLGIVGGFAGIYALTVATEGWMLDEVGWLTRILMGACALLFFAPGIQLTLVGIQFEPALFHDASSWPGVLFGIALFTHRSRRPVVAMEGT
jgi:TRAP-type uncharacterized transport system fused permease subunit